MNIWNHSGLSFTEGGPIKLLYTFDSVLVRTADPTIASPERRVRCADHLFSLAMCKANFRYLVGPITEAPTKTPAICFTVGPISVFCASGDSAAQTQKALIRPVCYILRVLRATVSASRRLAGLDEDIVEGGKALVGMLR